MWHHLAESFSTFLTEKILNIRQSLQTNMESDDSRTATCTVGTPLQVFTKASHEEVKKLIMKSDPIPTCLLKQCINKLLPLVTDPSKQLAGVFLCTVWIQECTCETTDEKTKSQCKHTDKLPPGIQPSSSLGDT